MDSDLGVSADRNAPSAARRSSTPIMFGAALLLAIVAALALWPDDESTRNSAKPSRANASTADDAKAGLRNAGTNATAAGLAPRTYDEPAARPQGRINPAVRLPELGLAPEGPPAPTTPPTFANVAEEIAWYEKKLAEAKKDLEARQGFYERLPAAKARAEKASDAARALAAYEQKAKIVGDNYTRAQSKVIELERKIAELRRK